MTPRTLVDAGALEAECKRIARDDHSCDQEEFITGLIAVAVPVRDAEGRVRAAVAVHAPTARMSLEQALSRLPALHAAAQRLSALL
jgi:DNA-binding IclR family transcriptional regulator